MTILLRLIFSLCLLLPLGARAIPLFTLLAPAGGVTAGSPFALQLRVEDAADLYGYQFDLHFDPVLLSAIGVTEGPLLSGAGPTLFLPGAIDNTAGTIAFVAGSLVGPIAGVSGDGLLLTFDFRALMAGTTQIAIDNVLLVDSLLGVSEPDAPPLSLTIAPVNGEVPVPGSLALLVVGLFAMHRVRSCQRERQSAAGL